VKYKKQRKNSGKNPSFAYFAKVKGGKSGRGRRTIDIGQWTCIDNSKSSKRKVTFVPLNLGIVS
jgi:hypothetical protein